MNTQLSLVPAVTVDAAPEPEPFEEIKTAHPDDTCSQYPCYDPETQQCKNPAYAYGIDSKLAASQRLCDVDDDKTEAGKD